MLFFKRLYERQDLWPRPEEWMLIFWVIGNLMAEIVIEQDRRGLGLLRSLTIGLAFISMGFHVAAALVDHEETRITLLYIRSQFLATACLFANVSILS